MPRRRNAACGSGVDESFLHEHVLWLAQQVESLSHQMAKLSARTPPHLQVRELSALEELFSSVEDESEDFCEYVDWDSPPIFDQELDEKFEGEDMKDVDFGVCVDCDSPPIFDMDHGGEVVNRAVDQDVVLVDSYVEPCVVLQGVFHSERVPLGQEGLSRAHLDHILSKFYQSFCKQSLWSFFHYMLLFFANHGGRFDSSLWELYVAANKIFWKRVIEVTNPEGDYVWIHVYHLLVLLAFWRRKVTSTNWGTRVAAAHAIGVDDVDTFKVTNLELLTLEVFTTSSEKNFRIDVLMNRGVLEVTGPKKANEVYGAMKPRGMELHRLTFLFMWKAYELRPNLKEGIVVLKKSKALQLVLVVDFCFVSRNRRSKPNLQYSVEVSGWVHEFLEEDRWKSKGRKASKVVERFGTHLGVVVSVQDPLLVLCHVAEIVFEDFIKESLVPDEHNYGILIDGLRKQKWKGEAHVLFDSLEEKGFSPDTIVLSSLIGGYCKIGKTNGLCNEASLQLEKIVKVVVKSMVSTCNMLISLMPNEDDFNLAQRRSNQMASSGGRIVSMVPNSVMCALLIILYACWKLLAAAFEVLKRLFNSSFEPSQHIFFLFKHFLKEQRIVVSMLNYNDTAAVWNLIGSEFDLELFRKILAHGFLPKVDTCNQINELCTTGILKVALRLFIHLNLNGFSFNEDLGNSVFRCYCKRGIYAGATMEVNYKGDDKQLAIKENSSIVPVGAGVVIWLNAIHIINEAIAATIAYNLGKKAISVGDKIVLIVDLAGGTFVVSFLTIEGGRLEVRTTIVGTHLGGGGDFDNRMANPFVQKYKTEDEKQHCDYFITNGWFFYKALELIQLNIACGGIMDKEMFIWKEYMAEWAPVHILYGLDSRGLMSPTRLSSLLYKEGTGNLKVLPASDKISCVGNSRKPSSAQKMKFENVLVFEDTQQCQEQIGGSLNVIEFRKCMVLMENCSGNAKMDKSSVHDVVLFGGATRISKVLQLLQDFFKGEEFYNSNNPGEALAYAVVQAAILGGGDYEKMQDFLWLDVISLSCGWETITLLLALKIEDPANVHLIRGNHEIINPLFGFLMDCIKRMGTFMGGYTDVNDIVDLGNIRSFRHRHDNVNASFGEDYFFTWQTHLLKKLSDVGDFWWGCCYNLYLCLIVRMVSPLTKT